MIYIFQFISDYYGQDRFLTRIGVGGLINMEKLKKANSILTDIQLFQYHSSFLLSDSNATGLHFDTWYVDNRETYKHHCCTSLRPVRIAQSVTCLGLCSGVRRFNFRVRHLSLVVITSERVNTELSIA